MWLIGGGAALLGLVVFLWLSSHRNQAPPDMGMLNPSGQGGPAIVSPPPAPPEVDAMEAAGRGIKPPQPAVAQPPPLPVYPLPNPVPAHPADVDATTRSPVLVVDFGDNTTGDTAGVPASGAHPGAATASASGSATQNGATASSTNGNEQFAARIETGGPDQTHATKLRDRSTVVAQGAMIPAVLETAVNSDLPGYVRAVVSSDVRSFDGTVVLIPRGSRVVGEYRSAVATGQSRAFIIWTRVLRPDGVSIQIGSPVTDPLGRAGLSGSVDRHYLENFGGAILLTFISAGATALAGVAPSTEVVIGSSQASGLSSTASAFVPSNISPTIKIPQGTPIRIFVARDLDFGAVQGHGG
jgi:type IV secretion system protein VirB10